MAEALAIIAFCIICLAVAGFIWGPQLLEGFIDKMDEWEEIMDSLKDEK